MVYVIDTLSTGPEMVLIIEKLRELIESGMDHKDIYESITKYNQKTNLVGFVSE